jgi:hypothetical protein
VFEYDRPADSLQHIELSPKPMAVSQMIWDEKTDQAISPGGGAPTLLFQLDKPRFLYEIAVELELENESTAAPYVIIQWSAPDSTGAPRENQKRVRVDAWPDPPQRIACRPFDVVSTIRLEFDWRPALVKIRRIAVAVAPKE